MLALRLARGAHPVVLLRRLSVAAASAGTGFLLLCTLGHALGHVQAASGSLLRLAWCVAPVAATIQLAVAVSRTDPGIRPRAGLSAVGLGPARLMTLAAVSTAVSCLLGSMVALLFFLHLRGDLSGLPFDGAARELLAADQPLPLPAALTLLAVVPVAGALASALALKPARGGTAATTERASTPEPLPAADELLDAEHDPASLGVEVPGERRELAMAAVTAAGAEAGPVRADDPSPADAPFLSVPEPPAPAPAPTGLPWGVALMAAGVALEMYAARSGQSALPLPGRLAGGTPASVLFGLAVTAVGLALAGPGLTYLCGKVLGALRPGAARLLGGRVLQEEARRIGRPLGVVCAVAAVAVAVATLHESNASLREGAATSMGPLTVLGACLVAGCTALTLLSAAVESRQERSLTTAALLRLGAPVSLLRAAAGLRLAILLAVFGPLTWAIGRLATVGLMS
ncbi:hypothetical protein DSC45_30345 [Streptomyces sp. YIM 130001]|uniref:hypothetical protein n=1 Tax=Streptomyces sp. YIM 130001 TaxID=2259644 RepID=UPI000E6526B7|nr:hypothetical protein [Streptomyces sp. YIM 130001]RII09601.1 hypothetical protein DSC45_30345 [Streptomyces sp. YIM 130001]